MDMTKKTNELQKKFTLTNICASLSLIVLALLSYSYQASASEMIIKQAKTDSTNNLAGVPLPQAAPHGLPGIDTYPVPYGQDSGISITPPRIINSNQKNSASRGVQIPVITASQTDSFFEGVEDIRWGDSAAILGQRTEDLTLEKSVNNSMSVKVSCYVRGDARQLNRKDGFFKGYCFKDNQFAGMWFYYKYKNQDFFNGLTPKDVTHKTLKDGTLSSAWYHHNDTVAKILMSTSYNAKSTKGALIILNQKILLNKNK
jgi:hypothetical protein